MLGGIRTTIIPLNAWHAPGAQERPCPLIALGHIVTWLWCPRIPQPLGPQIGASPRSDIGRSKVTAQFCRRHNNLLLVDVMSPCACPSCLLAASPVPDQPFWLSVRDYNPGNHVGNNTHAQIINAFGFNPVPVSVSKRWPKE